MLTDRATEESADGVVLMVFNHYKVIIRNLTWALVASILPIFLSNFAWLIFFNQYDIMSFTQDGAGVNNISTGDGSVLNGTESFNFVQERPEENKGADGAATD